jgi:hypothetical protein
MPKRRLIIYSILILLEFLTSSYFILFPIRWAEINHENVALRYWEMRIVILLINIIVAFALGLQWSNKFKLLLGLVSGCGLYLFSYLLPKIIGSESIVLGIVTLVSEGILQIILIEFMVRYMDKNV